MRKATLICDLQFGSTGKGLIAGILAERDAPDVVMTSWGANAGHTYIDAGGRKYVHTMIANGCVSPKLEYILVGPGSSINLDALFSEAREVDWPDTFVGILIHPHTGVISQKHREAESSGNMVSIGSTRKGVGECVIDKIRRNPDGNATAHDYRDNVLFRSAAETKFSARVCTQIEYAGVWRNAKRIQIEGAQGFSLGINSGMYPYVTSRECTPAQILSDLCLPIGIVDKVVGCLRTYPIRVANRYDGGGVMVGTSGPCYSDQRELDWVTDLGMQPELTTVTKLPRRIFTFSLLQLRAALRVCTPDELFLNFCNYKTKDEIAELVRVINNEASNSNSGVVKYMGYGPSAKDVVTL